MKLDKLVGIRFKEKPSEASIDSHAIMLRGGYMKQVANGLYSSYTPLKRLSRNVENIIREEMDALGCQEVSMPVVLPAVLWKESGRWESVANELLRFKDRNGTDMLLGMTHEEASVHLTREYGESYNKYPFMIYQIQTKFRDEARSRAGLIRVREFTMKDAYSFHTSQADLEAYYELYYRAYERIYARTGLPNVISVQSDSGMMGGSLSHEFMAITPVGEDTIVMCDHCDYRSNMESAKHIIEKHNGGEPKTAELVHTPGAATIEELSQFLNLPVEQLCKAVVYQKDSDNSYVILFIRGDLDANETKIQNYIKDTIHPAIIDLESGLVAGYTGPLGLGGNHTVLFDESLIGATNLVSGGNKEEYHYVGLNLERDLGEIEYGDFSKAVAGHTCPVCKKGKLELTRGIEVGNIFQLGTKYTESMDMHYLDENGETHYPIMGCYGIGVGRLVASVCEELHDDFGPIWPISIAPWKVHICCVRPDDQDTHNYADQLYADLQAKGIEAMYDDRAVTAGVMFSDADLLGAPIRAIVSPRNMKNSVCEIVTRDKTIKKEVPLEDAVSEIIAIAEKLQNDINAKVPKANY